jgi:hypothetical protein
MRLTLCANEIAAQTKKSLKIFGATRTACGGRDIYITTAIAEKICSASVCKLTEFDVENLVKLWIEISMI